MKIKKMAALIISASIAASMAVPVMAAEIPNTNTVFETTDTTTWYLKEAKGGNTAYVGENELTTSAKQSGSTVKLVATSTDTSNDIIQVRPDLTGDNKIYLEKGVTYNFSIDYTSNITAINTQDKDAVYAVVRNLYLNDSNNETKDQEAKKVPFKSTTANLGDKSGTITGSITPAVEDTYLEIQLYARYIQGTVTYSNILVTSENASVPSGTVASAVVDSTTKYYDCLEDAVKAVSENGTVTLYQDTQLSERILLGNSDKGYGDVPKTFTIDGNNNSVKAPSGQSLAIELASGYNITLNNLTLINGSSSAVNVKGGATLTASKVTFTGESATKAGLQIGGYGTATLTDSSVEYLTLYGTLTLNGASTVNNVYLPQIKPGTSDVPVITINDTSSVTGDLTINAIDETNATIENYELVKGNVSAFAPTYENDTYVLTNGVFVLKTVPEVITMTPEFVGAYEGDSDGSVAVAYKASFTSSTGDTASFNVSDITWSIDGDALSVAEDNAVNNVTVTLADDAAVVYGIIITGVGTEGTLSADFN